MSAKSNRVQRPFAIAMSCETIVSRQTVAHIDKHYSASAQSDCRHYRFKHVDFATVQAVKAVERYIFSSPLPLIPTYRIMCRITRDIARASFHASTAT